MGRLQFMSVAIGHVGLDLLLWRLSLPRRGIADLMSSTATCSPGASHPALHCLRILRARLRDIDILINRTLVYGTLTA